MSLPYSHGVAGDWDFTPRLGLAALYTDNASLDASGMAQSDLIFEINPGFSADLQGGRVDLNLDYSMQNLIFSNNSGASRTDHQLLGTALAELLSDELFLEGRGSVRQTIVSPAGRVGFDNVSSTDNRTDVITLGISPFWQNDFAGRAEARARYDLDATFFGEGASDSLSQALSLGLSSGRRFALLAWDIDYRYAQLSRAEGEDSRQQNVLGRASYALSQDWSLLARAGYIDSEFATLESDDGAFWSLGAEWTPSRRIEVTALYGPDDREFRLRLSPTVRTDLEIAREERDVGVSLNQRRWLGSLSHRTRFSTWSATYTQEPTSIQAVQFTDVFSGVSQQTDAGEPAFGDLQDILDPQQPVLGLPGDEFVRKRFQAAVGYGRGRSQLNLNAFNELREFQTDAEDEQAFGAGASWNWRFGSRTASLVGGDWQQSESDDGRQDEFWRLQFRVSRELTPDASGSLGYQHFQRDSNLSDLDATENRFDLRFLMTF